MQTIYYQTPHFIQHTGNMVDLDEFRRRQALAASPQRDSLARQPEEVEQPAFRPVVLVTPPAECRRDRRAWTLDACASLSVVVMTLLFALRVML